MSAAIHAPRPSSRDRRTRAGHFHLPSIHVRDANGNGFDYEEDYFLHAKRGGGKRYERVVTFAFVEHDQVVLVRKTRDELCGRDMRHRGV